MSSPSSAWSEPAPGVLVRQSRAYRMNSTVIARDGHALVVDPGVLPTEMDDLAARVAAVASDAGRVTVAFTHPHWDHVLGRPHFPGARTLAHVGFADELGRDAAAIEASAREWITGAGEAWSAPFVPFAPALAVRGTARIECGPITVIAHEVPGHCASQIALHLPRDGVLVAADTLSDIEIPWLAGPPWVYRRSLMALHALFEHDDVRVLVPGHGSVALGRAQGYARVLRDLDYLLRLEREVAAARARGLGLEAAQAECARMDYLGRDAAYAMNEVHRENVRFAFEDLAARSPA